MIDLGKKTIRNNFLLKFISQRHMLLENCIKLCHEEELFHSGVVSEI